MNLKFLHTVLESEFNFVCSGESIEITSNVCPLRRNGRIYRILSEKSVDRFCTAKYFPHCHPVVLTFVVIFLEAIGRILKLLHITVYFVLCIRAVNRTVVQTLIQRLAE